MVSSSARFSASQMRKMIFNFLLVLGICSTPLADGGNVSRQIPQHEQGVSNTIYLHAGYAINYRLVWWSRGSGAKRELSLYLPLVQQGYAVVGTVAISGYVRPTKPVIVFRMASTTYAKPAYNFTRVYADFGLRTRLDGSVWRPNCPKGYYSISDFAQSGYEWPGTMYEGVSLRPCIAKYCLLECTSHSVWDDRGTRVDQQTTFWVLHGSYPSYGQDVGYSGGFFRVNENYTTGPTGNLSYCINPKCVTNA